MSTDSEKHPDGCFCTKCIDEHADKVTKAGRAALDQVIKARGGVETLPSVLPLDRKPNTCPPGTRRINMATLTCSVCGQAEGGGSEYHRQPAHIVAHHRSASR